MDKLEENKLLLEIVETWRPNEFPEYRGFRCANCQQYKNKAWYHWLNSDEYKLPVHLCDDTCQSQFKSGTIHIDQSKRTKVDRSTFGNGFKYNDKALKRFGEIVSSWPEYKNPELKNFSCDECGKDLDIEQDGQRKGYHI